MEELHIDLEIDEPSSPPHLDLSWPTERKKHEILTWVNSEFQPYSEFDFANIDFEADLDNFDDLFADIDGESLSSRELVLKYFKDSIFADQIDEIVKAVDEEALETWLPADHRISMIEYSVPNIVEESVDQNQLLGSLADIVAIVEAARNDIPDNFGHNQGSDFPLRPQNLEKTLEILKALEAQIEADPRPEKLDRSKLKKVATLTIETSKALTAHLGAMASVSTLKFSEKFGESAGTWAGRASILYLFGEMLLKTVI